MKEISPAGDMRADIAAILSLLLTTALLYGHTLHVSFYLDDNALFNGTYLLRDLPAALRAIFSQRGLTNLTFAINYRLADWSLAALHLVNIALHAGCGLLVWRLLRQFFPGRALPLLGALLFVAHPLQTQAVTYLAQRATVLGAFLFLLALLLYRRARVVLGTGGSRHSVAWLLPFCGALLVGGGAVLAKENAAILPLLLVVHDRIFPLPERRSWQQWSADYLPFCLVPLVLGAKILLVEAAARAAGYSPYPLASLQHNSPLHYLVTQFSVLWVYLRLLILPYGQALEHDYPVVATLCTWQNGVALLGLLVLGLLVWRIRRGRPLLAFGTAWFFLALAVESSVIPLDPLFEHRLYLPMFGFVLVLLDGLPSLLGERRTMLALGVGLLFCLPLTWQRNQLWTDPIAFYESNLRAVPDSERAMIDLAARYDEAGEFEKMERLLERAVRLRPYNHEFYNALAEVYANRGDFDPALRLLDQGLALMPDNLELYERAALVAERAGRRELIFAYLQRGLASGTMSKWRLLNDLGIYFAQQGELARAEDVYRQSLALYSDNPVACQYLGALYFSQQRFGEALNILRQADRLEPGNPKTLEGIVRSAVALGDRATAVRTADRLRHIDPQLWFDLRQEIDSLSRGGR